MGKLLYGSPPVSFPFDDYTLTHLHLAMLTKLRRGEPFALILDGDSNAGRGRQTLWIHSSIALKFVFDDRHTAPLNPDWVRALLEEANSPRGLRILPEPSALN